jgi:hypothetical protein
MHWKRAFLVWLVLMTVESVHGILRTLLIQPIVGDFPARQISVFTGSLLILAVTYAFSGWLRETSNDLLLRMGVLWAILTVLFEVGIGRLLLHLSWERLWSDYDPRRGGLMLFGILVLMLAPILAKWLRLKAGRDVRSNF